ncbi:MAG: DCC1-like thiol-disulfide oxidoreductase family protein [Nocardioides sp.]
MAGTVIYDGECGFCSSANWLAERGRSEVTPWQSLDLAPLGLTEDDVTRAAYWLDASGHVSARGAGAVAEALKSCGSVWMIAGHLIYVRPVRPLADVGYAWVARNRHWLPGSTEACRSQPPAA